eukprot:GHVR01088221.1.p1 GENE.GHVR01088221.1~~GHVR01088221.1.p1  ORF type:complete len:117 (+),score=15.62 GHVR01088221.1:1169-1519(+)
MERARHYKTSSWLNVQPIEKNHHNLSPHEFRDAINIRYGRPLTQLPRDCDGCGAPLSTDHLLDCRKGGLVGKRHNEVRDAIADIHCIQECRKGGDSKGTDRHTLSGGHKGQRCLAR